MYLPRLIFIMLINNSKKPAKVLLFFDMCKKKIKKFTPETVAA